ncbi:MAG: tRNA (adenosine(37)-N6)-dimethylallyltransferase MiaA [Alphaproteobacteria bacterium]|nr:tRNA (adenosine(37)-N6)-dimethylallyltransferase MiaA [Alphaproteobacteria bacterium]
MALSSAPKRALLIAGPTASGKSAVAADLAARCGGVIINADAMQVYGQLRILSARPSAEEEARMPHRLYGHVHASERYSVGRWLEDVAPVLEAVWEAGQLPVVVGGTGLYFKALVEGLAPVPDIPHEVRARVADWYKAEGEEGLKRRLSPSDSDLVDQHRLIRALEVCEATGRSLQDWQQDRSAPLVAGAGVTRAFLMPDRQTAYARCEERFDMMLAAGAVAEVEALRALNLDRELPAMKAIGVSEISGYLAGEMGLEEAAVLAKTQTRRYVKRQMTWYRSQMPGWPALAPGDAAERLLTELQETE